jgi:hypothetical protein
MDTNRSVAGLYRRGIARLLPAIGVIVSQIAIAQAQSNAGRDGAAIATSSIASRYATNTQSSLGQSTATSYTNQPSFGNAVWSNTTQAAAIDSIYGGAEYLLIRTHFSQAIGYVDASGAVVNGLPTQSVSAREINFPYASAFRTYVGYQFTPAAALQLTYFHLNNTATISGTPSAPNHSFVDAYGDVAKFGQTMGGSSSVTLNVFDLDFVGRYAVGRQLTLRPAAGMRWADVRQHNDSTVTDPLAGVVGTGTFNTHFTGFGPHGSLLGQMRIRPNSPFSFIARGAGSLLIGGYSNTSGAIFTGAAAGDQTAHRTLTVPVIEAELGGAWQPTENLTFSAGWLWQAWFDLGVSGGTTYNGKFAETDSASIMSFDGLFLRGLWRY